MDHVILIQQGNRRLYSIITKEGKYTKLYLKNCRGTKLNCIHKFFTDRANKLYCSARCRYDSVLESNRKSGRRIYLKTKKRKILRSKGTFNYSQPEPTSIIGYVSPETANYNEGMFYYAGLSIRKLKDETFHGRYSKGKQKNPSSNEDEDSPLIEQYQYVTVDDIHALSIAYLKETGVKCPECGNNQNLVERAYLICSNPKCGLVLKAPVIHPGFTLYELTPIKRVAPTVQDFPPIDFSKKSSKNKRQPKPFDAVKKAHDKAYDNYIKESPDFEEDTHVYTKNDPLNPKYWQYYRRKKIYNKS